MACVFCGSKAKTTMEHIVPRWIGRLFSERPGGTVESEQRDGSSRTYNIGLFEQKVGAPCARCNHGWMEKLESGTHAFLGPMIKSGQATTLTPQMQLSLATWAVKTALMFEYRHKAPRAIPDSEYRRLYDAQQPPSGYLVWVAHRSALIEGSGRELLTASFEQSIALFNTVPPESIARMKAHFAAGHNAYCVTFTVGHAVFQVFGHNFPEQILIRPARRNVNVIRAIWPSGGSVIWPPPEPVDDIGGVDALHNAFYPPPPPDVITQADARNHGSPRP
jgi:hypothetical protein